MNGCLILDQDPQHADHLAQLCIDLGFEISRPATLAEASAQLAAAGVIVAFIDLNFEGEGSGLQLLKDSASCPVEVLCMSEHDNPPQANEAIRHGASYYFCKPYNAELIAPFLKDIVDGNRPHQPGATEGATCTIDQFGFLRGSSPGMHKLYRLLHKVAQSNVSLMVVGESGTGKELVAQTAHTLSTRADAPFVAFNCAAVAENLIESELFGHEKGSFSGAHSRHYGLFECAQGGTLFLDEITEMDVSLQAKLLRVIETKTLRRIGSEEDVEIDVRFISASNRCPEQAVQEGRLREDLYYRLAQFPLWVPPLRERGADVSGLAQYFLNALNQQHETEVGFTADALEVIAGRPWPGNVRELKNYVERAYIIAESSIDVSNLPDQHLRLVANGHAELASGQIAIPLGITLADAERELILASLQNNKGNKKDAAAELGISLKTLYNRLREYEEPPAQDAGQMGG